MSNYSNTGSIRKVTVGQPGSLQAGEYDILAYGGAGGAAGGSQLAGGAGAEVGGYFNLTNGEKLEIVAAGAGQAGTAAGFGGGGGGASEVFALNASGKYVPLLVAAGGGGSVTGRAGGAGYAGTPGDVTTNGGYGHGYGGNSAYAFGSGGGGAGSYSNGQGGRAAGTAQGGLSIANGAAGGAGVAGGGGNGGFGGGGGGGTTGGGGSGGADGGGAYATRGGSSGDSFVNGKYGRVDASAIKSGVETSNGMVVFNVVCFGTGTSIRTTRGDCLVEDLVVGDVAVTASGSVRPITWIGNREVNCRTRPDLHPVRVLAHAFGPDLPERDLMLSPGHPVLVSADGDNEGGHLVPIMCLINGTTIERVAVDEITYWHVELNEHDVLLAEGLPAESYIDLGSRPWFGGADSALYDPDMALEGMARRCRPVAIDGPVVEAEQKRLDMVFAMRLAHACEWPQEEIFAT